MGILRSVLTPAPDEIDSVRKALDAKATSEPVVREQRAMLSKPVPTWAAKISDSTEISHATLDELDAALNARLRLLEAYEAGPRRDRAIERHRAAAQQVSVWRAELGGDVHLPPAAASDSDSDPSVNHDEHHLSAI